MRKLLVFSLLLALVVVACNKEKRYSRKLMKGETWEVRNVTIDGSSLAVYGKWQITTNVDIYDSVPRLQWVFNNEDAVCEWQFQNKGKSFQLNYYQLCEECFGTDLDSLDYIVNDLSGTYDVERNGRLKLKFVSSTTKAFPGKKVMISIERN